MILRDPQTLRPHPVSLAIYGEELPDDALVASVLASGVLVPLTILSDGTIISGHRRRLAALKAGVFVPVVEVSFETEWDERQAIVEHNRQREKTLTQRMREGEELDRIERERAKVRQAHGQTAPGRTLPATLPEALPGARGESREKVAAIVGMKPRTYEKAKAVYEKAKAGDQRAQKSLEAIDAGKSTVHTEYKAIVQADRKAEQIAKVEAVAALPDGQFHVIVADPPWAYTKRSEDSTHRGASPYPSMTVDEICAMSVAERAADDCVLWLWTTNAFMAEAHGVAEAWGFDVKTILTWVKDRMGTGDWLRGQTEHCLMAVRGRPVVNLTNQTTVLHGPLREHSRKPDTFYALVETLCVGRRCELFSRQSRHGWIGYGAEWDQFPRSA